MGDNRISTRDSRIGPITYWPEGSAVQMRLGKWGNLISAPFKRIWEPGASSLISLERVQDGQEIWLVAGETVGLYCCTHEALELVEALKISV